MIRIEEYVYTPQGRLYFSTLTDRDKMLNDRQIFIFIFLEENLFAAVNLSSSKLPTVGFF
jgi:hypothetical protein